MTEQIMAEMIEAAYTRIMSQYTQSVYRAGKQDQKHFLKAAKICMSNNFDPALFVLAQDMYRANRGVEGKDYFWSTLLGANGAVENYMKFLDRSNVDLAALFEVQKTYLLQAIELAKRPVKNILMDPLIDFTPWFRILVTKQEIPEVMAKYREEARKRMTPKLRKFLSTTPGLMENLGRIA